MNRTRVARGKSLDMCVEEVVQYRMNRTRVARGKSLGSTGCVAPLHFLLYAVISQEKKLEKNINNKN